MSSLLRAEFYKLGKLKSFWGLIVSSWLLNSILMLDDGLPANVSSFFDHSLHTTPLLYVLIMIFGALFIGADFDHRTIQNYIAAGHKRNFIMFSKIIVHLIGCISILFVPLLVSIVTGCILFGIPDSGFAPLLLKSLQTIWIICAMGMLPCLSAFLFKDTGRTLTIPLILYFIMLFLLNGEHYDLMAVLLPMGQLRLLSSNQFSGHSILAVLIDCVWIIGCFLWIYRNFSRTDLK